MDKENSLLKGATAGSGADRFAPPTSGWYEGATAAEVSLLMS